MVMLQGKGAMTGVNLVAKVYNNGETKDGKSHYADIQVDARDPRAKGQTNLNLKSEARKDAEGKPVLDANGRQRFSNGAPYSKGQLEEIVKAAGPNKEPLVTKDGKEVGTVYGLKGSVMPSTNGSGLVVNTKKVEPGEFKVDKDTIANQFDAMREARDAAKAAKQNEPEQTQEAAAEAPAVEQDEPAVG
ncbi:hypothetical protein [Brevibacterium oceani]|uniref:hypothetical protein n=1 Tax=Brevibacterium oceani TaxID=358099 RepID=UPI0015E6B6A6|nr:hypothetical protein [Brevibacterium oceani]